MPKMVPQRWETRFGRWAHKVGPARIAAELTRRGFPSSRCAVYNWTAADIPVPTLKAVCIERWTRGAVTVRDMERHYQKLRRVRPEIEHGETI